MDYINKYLSTTIENEMISQGYTLSLLDIVTFTPMALEITPQEKAFDSDGPFCLIDPKMKDAVVFIRIPVVLNLGLLTKVTLVKMIVRLFIALPEVPPNGRLQSMTPL
jgi:hypothetical protein